NTVLASLHVMENATTAGGGIVSEGFGEEGQINIVRNNQAGIGARVAVSASEILGRINFSGYNGATFNPGAEIYGMSTESQTGSAGGTELNFRVTPTGTIASQDIFKLGSDGTVSVNPNNSFSKTLLDVKGRLKVDSSLTMAGYTVPPQNAPLNEGRIYYDRPSQKFMVSENGTLYKPLLSSSPWIQGVGTVTLANAGDKVGIGTSTPNNLFQVKDYITFESLGSNTSLGYLTGVGTSPNDYYNTFVGYYSGQLVGTAAGTATGNSFFGYNSGANSINGNNNSFVGSYAGQSNTSGNVNTFVGAYSGRLTTTGSNNSFIGYGAGYSNTTGEHNTALGYNAGQNNTSGRLNTFIGSDADLLSTTQYTNATAIGFNAKVNASDAIVLGNGTANVGIGTTTPSSPLHISNTAGSQIKFGNANQPSFEWIWDVDGTSNLFLKNEGNGTPKTRLYMDVNTGFLGLGPNSPGYKLTVIGDVTDDKATIYAANSATTTAIPSHGVHGLTSNTHSLSAGVYGNNNSVG
ncbi:MAG: hypothetical protein JNM51_09070, partial [Bacteroidia bacterium]|nr:hypothetical protein [Bacteroidia bacterium]